VVIIGKKVNGRGDEQRIPQAVENNKVLAKGDQIIQRQVAYPVIAGGGYQLLHNEKQQQIYRDIQHIPCGGPLVQKIFQLCHRVLTSEKDNLCRHFVPADFQYQ